MEHLFFFKEDSVEVGQECHGFCPSCKQDTPHSVVTRFEREIRSVQCVVCGSTHAFRAPRGDVDDDVPEPISAARRRLTVQRFPWEKVFEEFGNVPIRTYSPREVYEINEVIDHPIFGEGYVSHVVTESKLEALFKDGARVLAYNRSDLPATAVEPKKGRPKLPRPKVMPVVSAKAGKNGALAKAGKGGEVSAAKLAKKGQPAAMPEKVPAAAKGSASAKMAPSKSPVVVPKKAAPIKAAKASAKQSSKPAAKKAPIKKASPAKVKPKRPVAKVKAKAKSPVKSKTGGAKNKAKAKKRGKR